MELPVLVKSSEKHRPYGSTCILKDGRKTRNMKSGRRRRRDDKERWGTLICAQNIWKRIRQGPRCHGGASCELRGNLLNISSVFHFIISPAELTFLEGHLSDYQDITVHDKINICKLASFRHIQEHMYLFSHVLMHNLRHTFTLMY